MPRMKAKPHSHTHKKKCTMLPKIVYLSFSLLVYLKYIYNIIVYRELFIYGGLIKVINIIKIHEIELHPIE